MEIPLFLVVRRICLSSHGLSRAEAEFGLSQFVGAESWGYVTFSHRVFDALLSAYKRKDDLVMLAGTLWRALPHNSPRQPTTKNT